MIGAIVGIAAGVLLAVTAWVIGVPRTVGLLLMAAAIPIGLVELPIRLAVWPFVKRFEMLYSASAFAAGYVLWAHRS